MKLIEVVKEVRISIELDKLDKYLGVLTRVINNMVQNDDKPILAEFQNELSKMIDKANNW